ncbi:MAG TPA: site-specific DNA-methyltransferase [Dehalococcoidia bacterium]|nr:site-specific DNA-methyltransferase [Dehalococcoidia bacterium]
MSKGKKPIEQYDHRDKARVNNPPIGLVTTDTDAESTKKTYSYDPHLDPQLIWAGKKEHTSFEIPTISLHVHERIDPRSIIEAVRKRNGTNYEQSSFFNIVDPEPPLREAIEFYKHQHGWSNRLIAGDSLLVMNSLLEKEGLAGHVQMIYIDPPYGIKYGSNFQPFVNKRDVKDGKDEDLTSEPEMVKAFRDTWELGIHSYLTYLRDRLLLAKELLAESGSIFVQISDKNVHHVRELMDEIFKPTNYCCLIAFQKTGGFAPTLLSSVYDYLIWYASDIDKIKYLKLFRPRSSEMVTAGYTWIELENKEKRRLTSKEISGESPFPQGRRFQTSILVSAGASDKGSAPFEFEGRVFKPAVGTHWKTSQIGLQELAKSDRLIAVENTLAYIRYEDDFPATEFNNVWDDTVRSTYASKKLYVVQTSEKVIERCLLMTTDPGDLIFDPTCGSGTTAYVAEEWGRRWITCDTSRVAITLAKQRLMTALYDYYELAHPQEGVGSGFKYKTVPHITLKSIANNEPPAQETLYDQPFTDSSRARVSGPFTVEAVPSPTVKPISEIEAPQPADESILRSGETLRQSEWRAELLKTGIRGKKGQYILFSRIEPLAGTRWLQAEGETKPNLLGADRVRETKAVTEEPQRVVICFGPEHSPLDKKQVEYAIQEAQTLVPKPKLIVFAAFQFDPEAARDIDETSWPGVTLLKAQMNADLLTEDLKKKRASDDSFWLIGQPDVKLEPIKTGKDKGKHKVEVQGFDYYNTKTGQVESGGTANIAMWMLDTDYDGRSLFPRQVFFPMAGEKEGWSRLARNLKAEIDEERIESYRGTVSLPFMLGDNRRIAVKIVDDRGIESLKIIEVDNQ